MRNSIINFPRRTSIIRIDVLKETLHKYNMLNTIVCYNAIDAMSVRKKLNCLLIMYFRFLMESYVKL